MLNLRLKCARFYDMGIKKCHPELLQKVRYGHFERKCFVFGDFNENIMSAAVLLSNVIGLISKALVNKACTSVE